MIRPALCAGPLVAVCVLSSYWLTLGRNTKCMEEKDISNIKSCNKCPSVLQTSHSVVRAVWARRCLGGRWLCSNVTRYRRVRQLPGLPHIGFNKSLVITKNHPHFKVNAVRVQVWGKYCGFWY